MHASKVAASDLGPLALLPGVWKGQGFNTIWRPSNSPARDNILELNATSEELRFDRISGGIPNRGMVQGDIVLTGLIYQQSVADVNTDDGIHVEPGLWLFVPATQDPVEPATVVRMASIPHGTTLQAQGLAVDAVPRAPEVPPVDITPFPVGQPGSRVPFPDETDLSRVSEFRVPSAANPPHMTQAQVNNPNSLLTDFLSTIQVTSSTALDISTDAASAGLRSPVGGGTDNIAFLVGAGNRPNANAVQVQSTFWIVRGTEKSTGVDRTWLLYTQTVNLNFNGLTWPHVSVAVLTKQG